MLYACIQHVDYCISFILALTNKIFSTLIELSRQYYNPWLLFQSLNQLECTILLSYVPTISRLLPFDVPYARFYSAFPYSIRHP